LEAAVPEESELDRIDPVPETLTLSSGFEVDIVRLRTRQLFRLLRILTQGAGPAVMQAGLDFSAGAEQFSQSLAMLVLMSIPEAEQAAIGFLQSMCQPSGLVDKPRSQLTKQEGEDNQALWDQFNTEMFNPEPADTVDLIEVIVRRESADLQALGKKLRDLWQMFVKTGQSRGKTEPEPSPSELAESSSPGRSPRPSTSSATSTGGQTSTSSVSPSAGSGSARKRPAAAGSRSG
jgi:hypothetical protein